MEKKLKPFTIFEGPDCAGKSTLVHKFRSRRGSDTVVKHHGSYKGISEEQLPRFYLEHMLPMLLGYEEHVWDRCWLSEPIYGLVYRGGQNRIDQVTRRHLERVALRHGAVVVLCLPPWEKVRDQWVGRKDDEMLDDVDQLKLVYDEYAGMASETDLPVVLWDYTRHSEDALFRAVEKARPRLHPELHVHSVGNLDATVCLVGDTPSALKNNDTIMQFPFATFSKAGSSRWLTECLIAHEIDETELAWVNADNGVHWLRDQHFNAIIALGENAASALDRAGIHHLKTSHPQYHKRFGSGEEYKLFDLIQANL